jgi:hypothetical protein
MRNCQWCGQLIVGGHWSVEGRGFFCSEKCCNEWKWENGGKQEAQEDAERQRMHDEFDRNQERLARETSAGVQLLHDNAEAEREHSRPFIEKRLGRPLRLDEVVFNARLNTCVAMEELRAELYTAIKTLEKETGVPVSDIIVLDLDNMKHNWGRGVAYCSWGKLLYEGKDCWYFSLPNDMQMGSFTSSHLQNSILNHWFDAASLSPFIALAEYEGRKIQDVTDFKEYAWVEDRSCLVSLTELRQKLECEEFNTIEFSPAENIFFTDDNKEIKEFHLFKKSTSHWRPVHRTVSLDELQTRIPVKKIVPPKAAPPAAEEYDDFDDDGFDLDDEEDDEFGFDDAESEEIENEAAKAAQAAPAPARDARVCPQCGAALKAAAKFCGSCGAKVGAQPAGKVCPGCGNPVSATAKFCGNCRTNVS